MHIPFLSLCPNTVTKDKDERQNSSAFYESEAALPPSLENHCRAPGEGKWNSSS